ncbi:DNA repair protein/CtIP [Apiospora sp. TS-2023a]
MESWFGDTGKPALFQAFTQACSRIEKDFNDSIETENQKKAALDAELQSLRVRAASVDRLEQQNKELKEELAELKRSFQQRHLDAPGQENISPSKSRFSRPPSGNPRAPLTPVSINIRKSIKNDYSDVTGLSHRELATEYGALDGKYRKLRSQTADLVQANETLQSELRERTKTTHSWKEYATRQKECAEKRKGLIKRLKEELAAATNNVSLDSSFTSDTNPNSPNPQVSDAVEAQGALRTRDTPSLEPLAQNDDSAVLQHGKSPNELDEEDKTPNGCGDGQAVEEPTLPPIPLTHDSEVADAPIKDEPSSDIPVVVSERPVRRRRNEGNSSLKYPASTRVKNEEGSDPAITDDQRNFVPHESIDFDDGEESLSTPKRSRTSHQTATTTLARGSTPQDNLPDTEDLPHDLASNSSPVSTEHVSMSAHARISAGTLANKHAVSISDGRGPTLLRGIASLAEDDDRDDSTEITRQTFHSTGRLDSLLKTASPEKQTIRTPRGGLSGKPQTKGFVIPSASTRTTHIGKEGRETVSKSLMVSETPSNKTLKRTSTAIQPKPQALDTTERSKRRRKNSMRLRDRPQWTLRLGDFKINPKHNDGLDYAFSEVVRNKEDRLCLPGCVKEECCAPGFRNQARGERLETGAIAFQSLLENWLGDEAWRLSSMSEDEKEALWLKAKTQQVANEYGKSHRHRVQRATTPPGYFNADFPSTQQLDEDNQLTAVMQRERVDERYREAMKPNQTGRWLFRDE